MTDRRNSRVAPRLDGDEAGGSTRRTLLSALGGGSASIVAGCIGEIDSSESEGGPDASPTLFALGGGEITEQETYEIDTTAIEATGIDSPRALFLPTASGDASTYVDAFHEYFGEELGCETDVLRLVQGSSTDDEIVDKIAAADLVYTGGGDTGLLIDTWDALGIDEKLSAAWRDGTGR